MDWPEISLTDNMTPVDTKENNGGLITAQTETQISNNDNNKRLINTNLHPVAPDTLPPNNCTGDDNCDNAAVELAETKDAVIAENESIRSLENENQLNLSNLQISGLVNIDSSCIVNLQNDDSLVVSRMNLENDLIESFDNTKHLKLLEDDSKTDLLANDDSTKPVDDTSVSIEGESSNDKVNVNLPSSKSVSQEIVSVENTTGKLLSYEETTENNGTEAGTDVADEFASVTDKDSSQCQSTNEIEEDCSVLSSIETESNTISTECGSAVNVSKAAEEFLEEICDIKDPDEDTINNKLDNVQTYFKNETLTQNEKNNNAFIDNVLHETDSNLTLEKADKSKEDCIQIHDEFLNTSDSTSIARENEPENSNCDTLNSSTSVTNDQFCVSDSSSRITEKDSDEPPICSDTLQSHDDTMNENWRESSQDYVENNIPTTSSEITTLITCDNTRCDFNDECKVDSCSKFIESVDETSTLTNTDFISPESESTNTKLLSDSSNSEEDAVQSVDHHLKLCDDKEESVLYSISETQDTCGSQYPSIESSENESLTVCPEVEDCTPDTSVYVGESQVDDSISFKDVEENMSHNLDDSNSCTNIADSTSDQLCLQKTESMDSEESESVSVEIENEKSNIATVTLQTNSNFCQDMEFVEENTKLNDSKIESDPAINCENATVDLIDQDLMINTNSVDNQRSTTANDELIQTSTASVIENEELCSRTLSELSNSVFGNTDGLSEKIALPLETVDLTDDINKDNSSCDLTDTEITNNGNERQSEVTNIDLDNPEKNDLVISLSDDEECHDSSRSSEVHFNMRSNQDKSVESFGAGIVNSMNSNNQRICEDTTLVLSDSDSRSSLIKRFDSVAERSSEKRVTSRNTIDSILEMCITETLDKPVDNIKDSSNQRQNLFDNFISDKNGKDPACFKETDKQDYVTIDNADCASKDVCSSDSSMINDVTIDEKQPTCATVLPTRQLDNTLPETNKIITPENSNEVSDAVKFFFQHGSNNLDKFFGPASFQALQLRVHPHSVSSESELFGLSDNISRGSPGPQQIPNSCETSEPVPIALIPESLIDGSSRKLPPLLPKIPVAFLIPDMRNLAAKNLLTDTPVTGSAPELEMSHGVSAMVTSTITTPATTGANIAVVSNASVTKNTSTDVQIPGGAILQTQPQPQPARKPRKPRQRQPKPIRLPPPLPTPLFNNFSSMLSQAAGHFIPANLMQHALAESQNVVSSNNQRQQKVPKRQPRVKGAGSRLAQRVSTSINENNKSTCTDSVGDGVCGGRLQNVVNKLHQAVNANTPTVMSQESILHNLLMSKSKIPEHSGNVSSTIQSLKVMDPTLNLQNNIITTFRIPSALTIIPQTVRDNQPKTTEMTVPKIPQPQHNIVEDSVVNRLKKLGTIIEVERSPQSSQAVPPTSTPTVSSSLPPPPPLTPIFMTSAKKTSNTTSVKDPDITAQCLKMLESLANKGNVAAQQPKKKPCKRRTSTTNKRNDSSGNPSKLTIKEDVSIENISDPTPSAPINNAVSDQLSLTSLSSISCSSSTSLSSSTSSIDINVNKTVPSSNATVESEKKIVEVQSSVAQPTQQIDPKYVFQIDSSQVLTLPGAQRMLTCDICDGVYHKTMSLKKHYLKTHINKKYLSESDQIVCGMKQLDPDKPPPPKKITKIFIGDLSKWVNTTMSGLFNCFTCGASFDQKTDLKAHLVEHPPVSLMKVKEGKLETFMCSGCSKTFAKKKLFVQHRKICDQKHAGLLLNQHCLYCDKSFLSIVARNKHHFKMHHPKRKFQPCFVCKSKKIKDLSTLYKHMCLQHKDKYFGCVKCKLRYLTRTELLAHNKETHEVVIEQGPPVNLSESSGKKTNEDVNVDKRKKSTDPGNKHKCGVCGKAFGSELNVSRHHRLAHGVHPRKKIQTVTAPKKPTGNESNECKESSEKEETKTKDEKPPSPTPSTNGSTSIIDPETQFYSRITINIRENLMHHLDGKLDSQEMLECDVHTPSEKGSKSKLMNFSASFTSLRGCLDSDQSNLDSKQNSNPVSPKVPWEKFNFPKNYDGRCGLTSYIKDMSHLDISTQLTMRRNLQRLNSTSETDVPLDVIADVPAGLSLMGLSSAESFGETNSNENSAHSNAGMELSGEWTRPRSYVCAVCNLCTSNLWELEDHKVALHPNVWCPHHEVLAEHTSCWELVYNRKEFTASGALHSHSPNEFSGFTGTHCTKCNKHCSSSSDLHRHMLDCGGDTTWMSTMLAVSSPGSRRNRKWRPFGSRRRRQQGRRGLKRNIPNTPAKQPGMRIRTKPGDTESIQKMIANLPPKRITRRIIGEDVEIKTRSQGTLSSVPAPVNVIQKQRASLSKFVKKPDNSKNIFKSSTSGKSSKEIKTLVEDKQEKILPTSSGTSLKECKNLFEDKQEKVLKKTEKLNKKSVNSPSKKKQELANEVKIEIKVEEDVKEMKPDCEKEKCENNSLQNIELKQPIKDDIKLEGTEQEIVNCKEINIVVVNTRKSETSTETITKEQCVSEPSPKSVKQTREKSVDKSPKKAINERKSVRLNKNYSVNKIENDAIVEKKTVNDVEHIENENDASLQKDNVTPIMKEDKGINTDFDDIPLYTTCVSASEKSTSEVIQVDSKPFVSPKKPGKGKKDENEKKKPETEKKKKDVDESKSKICMDGNLIMCNGCGMQFDNTSACQRHMKSCVYWKEEKDTNHDGNSKNICRFCNKTFPYLMALIRHKCNTLEDDRAMPELIREEPFPEPEAAPVEITKDIPILSPEESQKISNCEQQTTSSKETNKQLSFSGSPQKVSSKITIKKRFSTIESIMDSISEVAKETFSLEPYLKRIRPDDKFIEINSMSTADEKKSLTDVNTTMADDVKNSNEVPNPITETVTTSNSDAENDKSMRTAATETLNSSDPKGVSTEIVSKDNKRIVIENATMKTVPKLVKLGSPISQKQTTKVKKADSEKSKILSKNQCVGVKRKAVPIRSRRGNKRRLLCRTKKKRSTDLEILLRDNKAMSESRRPVKTIEKRKINSPVRGNPKAKKSRKLNNGSRLDAEISDVDDKINEETKSESQDVMQNQELLTSDANEDNKEGSLDDDQESFVKPEKENEEQNSNDAIVKKDLNKNKSKPELDQQELECTVKQDNKEKTISEDSKKLITNEQLILPAKNQSRSPKKLKFITDESLIITGSRRKTNAINRWDMYRPSCSNGRVYCEPCNKEVKEDGMSKHEQSLLHIRNIDLKTDFDNLFPDAYKFVTHCSLCSWNFPTPFTCYKHYLQKHEDSLSEIVEQMLGKKDEKTTSTSNDATELVVKEEAIGIECIEPLATALNEESQKTDSENQANRIIHIENSSADSRETESPEIKSENDSSTQTQKKTSDEYAKTLKDLDHLKLQESQESDSSEQSKPEFTINKLLYCEVCNKGINSNVMSKHKQASTHKKNVVLKKEFDLTFPGEKSSFYPVFCDRCGIHFTSPFFCYKHYLWKHFNIFYQLLEEVKLKISAKDVKECVESELKTDNKLEMIERSTESDVENEDEPHKPEDLMKPSHLFCHVCRKNVTFDLILKHVNTSAHKQNVQSSVETDISLSECKWCRLVRGSPFVCETHISVKPEPVYAKPVKKKQKKKNLVKRNLSESDSDNEALMNLVKQGRIAKKRKKIKFKKIRDKLQSMMKDNSALQSTERSAERTIEIRSDVSTKITCDRLMKKRRKRFAYGQIRNRWEVSVVDPGLATLSGSSSQDIEIEPKSEPENSPASTPTSIKLATSETECNNDDSSDCKSPSPGGSEFFCMLCQKQFNSAISLVRHQSSATHRLNERKNVPPTTRSIKHLRRQETVVKNENTSNNTAKSKELPASMTSSIQPTVVSQFQGSESSETSQTWNDGSAVVAVDQRSQNIPQQEWSPDWIMSGSNSSTTHWDVNSPSITSQLWDNSDSSLMSAVGCSSSLGSILDSVNKILADDGDASLLPQYSLAELQSAMGATDEEMAMLQQLGERSLNDEFLYEGSNSVCSFGDQWSMSGPITSPGDDNTTTLMDLDNQQPPPPVPSQSPQPAPQQTITTSIVTNSTIVSPSESSGGPSVRVKVETGDGCDTVEKTSYRGLINRPKGILSDYESREMVCPSCCKHFLGLSALQQHVTWSHCSASSSTNKTRSRMWLKRRALLNQTEDVDRKLVCYVCKEIFNSATLLDRHMSEQHPSSVFVKKETASSPANQTIDTSDGAEKLKSKMSSALGGLLDRALNNLLCSKANNLGQSGHEGGSELSSGTIQILGKLCAVRRKKAAVNALQGLQAKQEKSGAALASELRQLMQKCGKNKSDSTNSSINAALPPTSSLDHLTKVLANGQDQRPYPCPVCGDRFLIPSARNRHIAQAHPNFRKKSSFGDDQETTERENSNDDSPDNAFEQDWRDASGPSYDSDGESGGQNTDVRPLCSDCGLSFSSIREMIKHRKELHPTQSIKDQVDLPVSENVVDSTSGEGRTRSRRCAKVSANQSLVGQVGSSRQTVRGRRRQRGAGVGKNVEKPDSLEREQVIPNTDKTTGDELKVDEKIKLDISPKPDDHSIEVDASTKSNRRKDLPIIEEKKPAVRRRVEKRKTRLSHFDEEDVRVKAEAALRELSLLNKNRTLAPSKWGIESLRFTKQTPTEHFKTAEEALSSVNFARAKYAMMMAGNKCNHVGSPAKSETQTKLKAESGNRNSDVYDFNDDELSTNSNKVALPYAQRKDEKNKNQDNNEKWLFFKDNVELPLDS